MQVKYRDQTHKFINKIVCHNKTWPEKSVEIGFLAKFFCLYYSFLAVISFGSSGLLLIKLDERVSPVTIFSNINLLISVRHQR